MAGDVVFRAEELLLKDGFDDGNLLDDILEESGYDTLADPLNDDEDPLSARFSGAVLSECVRRRLAPRLPGFEFAYDMSIAHNPVRLADWDEAGPVVRQALAGIEVRMSAGEILAVAAEVAVRFVDARPGAARLPGR